MTAEPSPSFAPDHAPTPQYGTAYTDGGLAADLRSPADNPVTAVCDACHEMIRREALTDRWRHEGRQPGESLREAAQRMALEGRTQRQVARALGVQVGTLQSWGLDWPRGRRLKVHPLGARR